MNSITLKYKNLNQIQKFAIAIPITFILFSLFGNFVQQFRFSDEFHWLYEYGSLMTLVLCLFCYVFSLANSIIIIRELKLDFRYKIIWLFLSSVVFFYITIMMSIAML